MPKKDIKDITKLEDSDVPLIRKMEEIADEQIKIIQDEDGDVQFQKGFHAIPSLEPLHMHVISKDFDSDRMKIKKHHNSFRTDFFITSDALINVLEAEGKIEIDRKKYMEKLKLPKETSKT